MFKTHPPKKKFFLYVEITPKGYGIRRWGLWEELRSEGVAIMNEISTLIKEIPESLFTPFHHMETQYDYSYESGRKPSP